MDEFDADERKLYYELYNLMGAKIRFKCDGYVQEGIIYKIIPEAKRVTLNRVYFILPDKRVFSGMLKYYFEDLTNYEVVATAKELNPYTVNEYIANLLKEDNDGKKKYSLNQLFFDGMLSEESEEEEEVEEVEESVFELEVPPHLKNKVPYDSVILDAIDLDWKQAIRHIKQQKVIGASFHGIRVSRLGKLLWVCISTSWCVFLIDIEKLGVDAFNNGLRGIFEDLTIKKVIHNCRFPSDCLAHLFDTKLANVFDTLIADFIATKQVYNDKYEYKYVQTLNSCLRIHLEVLPEFTYARDRELKKNDGVDYLSKRPVTNALKYVLIKDTIYLLLLHEKLEKKLLGPLHTNVVRYLNVLSGSSKEVLDTVGDEISSPDSIPPTILMHGIKVVQFRKPEQNAPISLECKFKDPITGKLIDKKYSCSEEKAPVSLECKNKDPITGKLIDVKKYSCLDDDGSKNSNNDNCVSEDGKEKRCYNENRNSTIGKGEKTLLRLKDSGKHIGTTSSPSGEKSVVVDRMIARPSGRHIDEVYHKLINNEQLRSQNAHNVINAKPAEKYVSKFTMRITPECVAFRDSVSDQEIGHSSSQNSAVNTSDVKEHFPDYSDTWAKLRAESCDVSQNSNNKHANIQFVPAGMPY